MTVKYAISASLAAGYTARIIRDSSLASNKPLRRSSCFLKSFRRLDFFRSKCAFIASNSARIGATGVILPSSSTTPTSVGHAPAADALSDTVSDTCVASSSESDSDDDDDDDASDESEEDEASESESESDDASDAFFFFFVRFFLSLLLFFFFFAAAAARARFASRFFVASSGSNTCFVS